MQVELAEQGNVHSRSKVSRLMKEAGLRYQKPRAYRPKTTDSKHRFGLSDNLLQQNFTATAPGKVWVTDITYVPTAQGFIYLAVVIDLFSRRIVGHASSDSLHTELCLQALELAKARGIMCAELIHHSDRGCQYASQAYRQQLSLRGIRQSMSRKGNCYDNAVAESFFATLEKELLCKSTFQTRTEAKLACFEYIEVFYNRFRRHSSIDYQSPEHYEKQFELQAKAA